MPPAVAPSTTTPSRLGSLGSPTKSRRSPGEASQYELRREGNDPSTRLRYRGFRVATTTYQSK